MHRASMRRARLVSSGVTLATTLAAAGAAPEADPPPPWSEILTALEPPVPAGREAIVWHDEIGPALAVARQEGRPLLVTMRCETCRQCAAFDQAVLAGGPELDPLLGQFVLVRITDAARIDLRLFDVAGFQDLDLSWWGWFLAPSGRVYGVFGGRDEVADHTRISVEALAATMRRILAHHYDPRREAWAVDALEPDLTGEPLTPRQLPGYAPWLRRSPPAVRSQTCLHCHQVAEILRQPALAAGRFDKTRDLAIWPLPENVGLVLDRDHGLRVRDVEPASAAARAGLEAGDVLGAADGRRLFGQADFRAALHRGPREAGRIEIGWLRDGAPHWGGLGVAEGWRATVLSWRMSVSQGNVGASPGFWPLAIGAERRGHLGLDDDAMGVKPFFGEHPGGVAWEAGLRPQDVVIAADDRSPNLEGRAFLTWFRLRYDPGDCVSLTVIDAHGDTHQIEYRLDAVP